MRRGDQEFVLRGKGVKAQGYGTTHVASPQNGNLIHTSYRE